MEKAISMKEVGEKLISYAMSNGKEPVQVFSDWLKFSCEIAEPKEVLRCKGLMKRLQECNEQNPLFVECFNELCKHIYEENKKGHACDGLGKIYEVSFQSTAKAAKGGQFFTPDSLCNLMADLVLNDQKDKDVIIYNDCASGSGRTMLAAWEKCDKYAKNFFSCQDIDPTSVMMCALNFMINGMVGVVECQNTLTQEWYFGYLVNTVKVPIANNMPSLQRVEDEEDFRTKERALRNLLKDWNVGIYRPK